MSQSRDARACRFSLNTPRAKDRQRPSQLVDDKKSSILEFSPSWEVSGDSVKRLPRSPAAEIAPVALRYGSVQCQMAVRCRFSAYQSGRRGVVIDNAVFVSASSAAADIEFFAIGALGKVSPLSHTQPILRHHDRGSRNPTGSQEQSLRGGRWVKENVQKDLQYDRIRSNPS